ncbi:hypothetical protein [Clostridium folliculivorans]|uniref:Uncharacterized protein n=1 Tax=Clostridium folliculivorans TaxID=2886038 RepID=A0A9W5Y1Y3_9CLOT|nr:hypothetical protein [Clostridium folliculivorans]GKU25236.1 hypothetical protein CFOLD11_20620 [Clostridium folliculivorans]GKU28257.1 hypothetical protein CFB3_03630 [Clostridium folliculivorans]
MEKSHVDMEKLNGIAEGEHFEFRDVVSATLPKNEHAQDGAIFNREVEEGVYRDIVVVNEDVDHVRYKKV